MSGRHDITFPTFVKNSKKLDMQQSAFLLLISLTFLNVPSVNSFNLDARNFHEIKNQPNEYFGYSIEFRKVNNQYTILVGSPKANDTTLEVSPGALYECKIKNPYNCRQILLNPVRGLTLSRDNQWLGVALDVNPVNSFITVCAHRLREYTPDSDSLPGVCYEFENTLSPQIIQTHPGSYFNANFGTSCRYSQSGKLLIGLPGAYNYIGGYYIDNSFYFSSTKELYEGYTVAFLNQYPVIGKPRYHEYGAVGVLNTHVLSPQTKYSFGSYFGSAIATADLNQDGYKDLVIGAPFYSEKFIEEGRVYIYFFDDLENDTFIGYVPPDPLILLTTNGFLFILKIVTEDGTRLVVALPNNKMFFDDAAIVLMEPHYRSQFGKSLVTGDFNQDQYQDVIVGAPYENDGIGCIYLYNGKHDGLDSKYSQKICGETLRKELRTFGISFTRAVDIDQNRYPDIGVGAYLSDSVYIFKARPTFSIKGYLSVSTPLLDIEPNCLVNNRLVLCVYLNVTLSTDSQFPTQYHYHLITDSTRSTDAKRTIFSAGLHEIAETVTVFRSFRKGFNIYIKNAVDILKPINFTLYSSLPDEGYSDSCQSLCPISKNHTTSLKLKFNLKCGPDEICQTRLGVQLKVSPQIITLGKDKTLTAIVKVVNMGEHAYNAKTRIFFPSFMDFESVSKPDNSSIECTSVNKKELSCFLGNPLAENNISTFMLTFLFGQISNVTKAFIAVNATTDSEVKSIYLINTVNSTITFNRQSDLELAATSIPETLAFTGKDGPMVVRHIYNLRNNGPSDALKLIFSVDIPHVFINNLPLMTIKKYQMHSGNTNVLDMSTDKACHMEDTETEAAGSKTDVKSLLKHKNIADCNWLKCRRIICELRDLPVVNTKIFELVLSTNTAILKQFQDKLRVFDFVSNGTLRHTISDQIINLHHNKANATSKYIISRLRKKIQWWIVVLSILVGLLFLIIVGLILWKLGFFQRNRVSAEDRKSLAVANDNAAPSETGPAADES